MHRVFQGEKTQGKKTQFYDPKEHGKFETIANEFP